MSTKPPGRRAKLIRNVAPGVHRIEHAHVNAYLLVEGGDVTIVDAALPATWKILPAALSAIGASADRVRALVLTHAHFDHLGFARAIAEEWSVPVYGHPAEEYIARHPYRYSHEVPRAIPPLTHPRGLPILTRMTAAGALAVRGVDGLRPIADGDVLSVPGSPRVVFSPGHTYGHSALHLADRDALITGDALVTLDPYTGKRGPRIVSGAATADSRMALESLRYLADTGASTVLPGHGEPWRAGIASAVRLARPTRP